MTRLSAVGWAGRIRNPDTDWLIASGKRHRNLASCFLSPPTTAISFSISPFRNWRCWWWSNQHLTRQPAVLGGLGRDERSCARRWGVAVTPADPSAGLSQHLHDFPFALEMPPAASQPWANLKGRASCNDVQSREALNSTPPRNKRNHPSCVHSEAVLSVFLVYLYTANWYHNAGRSCLTGTNQNKYSQNNHN